MPNVMGILSNGVLSSPSAPGDAPDVRVDNPDLDVET